MTVCVAASDLDAVIEIDCVIVSDKVVVAVIDKDNVEALLHEIESVTDGDPEVETDGVRVPEIDADSETLAD